MGLLSPANADSAPVIALHCSGAGAGQWRQLGEAFCRERQAQWLWVGRGGRVMIHPLHRYPTQLINVLQLRGGTRVVIR
jgi:hypothetical protein